MKNFIFLFLISTMWACANETDKSNAALSVASSEVSKERPTKQRANLENNAGSKDISFGSKTSLQERQLIKTADYRMQVENVDASTIHIQTITQEMSGVIANMNLNASTQQIQNSLTILVPNNNFESLLKGISREGTFINTKQITTKDVTEEFVDLGARLATKKQVRDRYANLLRNKASTIEEVFAAEEKFRVLQEEIEAKEGRLTYLQEKVAHSQVNLVIYETVLEKEAPPTYHASIGKQFKYSFANGGKVVVNFFLWIVNFWPLLLIGFGVLLYRRRWT